MKMARQLLASIGIHNETAGLAPSRSRLVAGTCAIAVAVAAPSVDAQTNVPCSDRYTGGQGLGLVASDASRTVHSVLSGHQLWAVWGLRENVSVESYGPTSAFLRVRYPEGSYVPSADAAPVGGAGFRVPLVSQHGGSRRACLSYSVRFASDFAFARGGKLPGLYGGEAPSGGDRVNADTGFSTRLMWREDGEGEVYAYVMNKDGPYGKSIGRGSWRFHPERWYRIDQEVVLNAPSRPDGQLRVWINGRQVLDRDDIRYRGVSEIGVDGLMFSTFFGGGDPNWASPKHQSADFTGFKVRWSQDGDVE